MNDAVFRGSTPLQEFIVPFVLGRVNRVTVTYRQNETNVMTKTVSSGFTAPSPDSTAFSYTLTQEETLKFIPNDVCYAQLNVLLNDGTREPSGEFVFRTGKQFYSEVLT